MMTDLPEMLTLEMCDKWTTDKVEIQFTEAITHEAQIIEVNALSDKKNKERIPFSLILLTELKEAYYEQGTFKVVLPDGREDFMFMVPIGVDSESQGMRYEVVYN